MVYKATTYTENEIPRVHVCMYMFVCVCMYMCASVHVYGGCEYIYIMHVFSLGKKILKGKLFEILFSFLNTKFHATGRHESIFLQMVHSLMKQRT